MYGVVTDFLRILYIYKEAGWRFEQATFLLASFFLPQLPAPTRGFADIWDRKTGVVSARILDIL